MARMGTAALAAGTLDSLPIRSWSEGPRRRRARVSLTSAGQQANGDSYASAILDNGRFAAFVSSATNLVPGDTNGRQDVFVSYRALGTTEGVSVSSAEVEASSDGVQPSISADGRFVAFASDASNLVPGDRTGHSDVFVRDRLRGTTARITVSRFGSDADDDSFAPSISADGRLVAFLSQATDLVAGDQNARTDVFVVSVSTGSVELASVGAGGAADDDAFAPALSDPRPRRGVGLAGDHPCPRQPQRPGPGLRPRPVERYDDAGVHGRRRGGRRRERAERVGRLGGRRSGRVHLRRDQPGGRRRERRPGRVRPLCADRDDQPGVGAQLRGAREVDSGYLRPDISADGRFVAYASAADNLVDVDTNGFVDCFVHELSTGSTRRVSLNIRGRESARGGVDPALSADGRIVAFLSLAPNLVLGDSNRALDVFVRVLS